MTEPWLSVIGGGFVAAVVTVVFNAWWDSKKEQSAQQWEFRRYRANLVHGAAFGLMDAFFAAKTEIDYLVGTLGSLQAGLEQLGTRADAIVLRQAVGQHLTGGELEQMKAALMQPFQTYNQQQVALRWNQYEQKMKDLEARAETYMYVLEPLIPADLHQRLVAMVRKLSEDYPWDLPNARQKLELFVESLPEFQAIQREVTNQIEVQLGRRR